jgi:hypothetical protein
MVVACVAVYGYSAINTGSTQIHNTSVDLSTPLSIVWPFEISVIGDLGEKGVRIPPKVGRGWRGEAGGEASYRFYIPETDLYRIWAYSLWFDECANAVFAQIDNMDRAVVGNDPVYGQWHWVRGFDVHLEKGTHTLLLSNHSDHIALQKVLFTNSRYAVPEECGLVFSDIFYDGFDGCDRGNFSSWKIVSGEWLVQDPVQKICFIENSLVGNSQDSAFIFYPEQDWSRYSLSIAVQPVWSDDADAHVGICFGVEDPNRYHQLRCRPAQKTDAVRMEVISKTADRDRVLADFDVPWKAQTWRQIEIELSAGKIVVRVEGAGPVEVPVDNKIRGGIGLCLEGEVIAYFDDVHVRELADGAM